MGKSKAQPKKPKTKDDYPLSMPPEIGVAVRALAVTDGRPINNMLVQLLREALTARGVTLVRTDTSPSPDP